MSRKRKRLIWIEAASLCIVLVLILAAGVLDLPDPNSADIEQYKVFSDYIAAGLTGESHDLGSPERLVVILDHTTVSSLSLTKSRVTEYRVLMAMLPHAEHDLALHSNWPIFSLLIRNLRLEHLRNRLNLPAQYTLASDGEIAGAFQRRFPKSYGYLTFTRVGFNHSATEAVFYTEHVCGLCGEGKFVYMRKLNGNWIVQAQSETWVS